MKAKCNCQHCNRGIEFEAAQAGQIFPCPHCGIDTVLFIPTATRKELRNKSAYSSGRKAVSVIFWVSIVGSIIVVLMCVGAFVTLHSNDATEIAFWAGIASFLVAWASREIAHAIFDIADCALRRSAEAEKQKPVSN